eukprot:TRINITY_DN22030_c0_g1_i1.p1 TRINITY_DN22030_c0_g1~~TRINITY_DN22030_c0_g1_i1.p1  ORF type:complete len:126 (+),score=22.18 TRINITY_DN22030_c0_g1_i1:256-633(+)
MCIAFRKMLKDAWLWYTMPGRCCVLLTLGMFEFCVQDCLGLTFGGSLDEKVKEYNKTVDPAVPIKMKFHKGPYNPVGEYIIYPQRMLSEGYVPGGGPDGIPPSPVGLMKAPSAPVDAPETTRLLY